MEWPFLSGEAGGRSDWYGDGIGIPVRIPLPCCTIRKLDGAYCRVALFTCCRFGSLFRSLGLRIGERCLFPDWSGNAGGTCR